MNKLSFQLDLGLSICLLYPGNFNPILKHSILQLYFSPFRLVTNITKYMWSGLYNYKG